MTGSRHRRRAAVVADYRSVVIAESASRRRPVIIRAAGRGAVTCAVAGSTGSRLLTITRAGEDAGPMLEGLGLSTDGARVYVQLLQSPPSSAGELAATVGLPEPVIAALLDELDQLGVVSRAGGVYSAVDPKLGLTRLAADRERELAVARAELVGLAARYTARSSMADLSRLVEVVLGKEVISHLIGQLWKGATQMVRVFDKPPYVADTVVVNPFEEGFLASGGQSRCLYEAASLNHRESAAIERWVTLGEEARTVPELPMKMILIDHTLAAIPLQPSDPDTGIVLVHQPTMVNALNALFDTIWARSVPLAMPGVEDPDLPTATERRLLELLASGLSDEAIARHLGCGLRTVQRHMRAMMVRLGVHTRFQLGMRAHESEWLTGGGPPTPRGTPSSR